MTTEKNKSMKPLLIMALVFSVIAGIVVAILSGTFDGKVTESQVRSALEAAGAQPELVNCMAPLMAEQMDPAELKGLEELSPKMAAGSNNMSANEWMADVRKAGSSVPLQATSAAAGRCSLRMMKL